MVDSYRYRIQSSPGWGAVVARVETAPPETLIQCLSIVRRHALEVLAESHWPGLAAVEGELERGTEGWHRIQAVAEEMDDRYLDAGVAVEDLPAGDPAHDHVNDLFVIARALAALVFVTELNLHPARLPGAVLEGAMEISVTSEEREARLRQELEAASTATSTAT